MAARKKPKKTAAEKAQEKLQRDHIRAVRSIFRFSGFRQVTGVTREFKYDGQTSDIDDLFIYENVILLFEYTVAKDVGKHLKNKKIIYDKILADPPAFIDFLKQKFPGKAEELETGYPASQTVVQILYCSRFDFDAGHKSNVPGPIYLDYPAVRYFSSMANMIRRSLRPELLQFLEIPSHSLGHEGQIKVSKQQEKFQGSVLPEGYSKFPAGFKILSFYVDPASLLKTSYVLRRDGWRSSANLYQRMISKSKISSIRKYLTEEKRVFINNIIVTLPDDLKLIDEAGNEVDPKAIVATQPVTFHMPDEPNKVGIIDGQHRIYSYYESGKDDGEITTLRKQQNLLATGIVYPKKMKSGDREKFEARLFLEINSNQTGAKTDLKQAINLVLDPFESESIAARVMQELASKGPLAGHVEQYFFDSDKLKTSSVVSFGLKPLVKLAGNDSLFRSWRDVDKSDLLSEDQEKLEEYIEYCSTTINRMLLAAKKASPKGSWTPARAVKGRLLTTTNINAFLITLRILIENKKPLSQTALDAGLVKFSKVDLSPYHSSQYRKMAEKIAEVCFGVTP